MMSNLLWLVTELSDVLEAVCRRTDLSVIGAAAVRLQEGVGSQPTRVQVCKKKSDSRDGARTHTNL